MSSDSMLDAIEAAIPDLSYARQAFRAALEMARAQLPPELQLVAGPGAAPPGGVRPEDLLVRINPGEPVAPLVGRITSEATWSSGDLAWDAEYAGPGYYARVAPVYGPGVVVTPRYRRVLDYRRRVPAHHIVLRPRVVVAPRPIVVRPRPIYRPAPAWPATPPVAPPMPPYVEPEPDEPMVGAEPPTDYPEPGLDEPIEWDERLDEEPSEVGAAWSRPPAPGALEDDDAEAVPTFAVGAADARAREFIELQAHVEDWIPNAAGTGLVISQFACRTQAELDAATPGAGGIIAGSPTPLWRTNPAGRLEAALDLLIFHPATAAGASTLPAGRRPLAIVCMGNHETEDGGVEVFSHHGYSGFSTSPPAVATGPYLQEALAEKGIISVSVSTNPANLLNLMLETRAKLVIAALRRMQQLDGDAASRYHRKIDFQRVALIGHSRGGDAVARAARLAPPNTRVRAVVQLAPTDMTGLLQGTAPAGLATPAGTPAPTFVTRPVTVPANTGPRQLIVWGSRDGDVSGMEDVRTDLSVNPFRHYDRSSVERAFQFWHGATHNRFNRLWTDAYEDGGCLSRTHVAAGLLSRPDQEARTVEMVRGWLLFSLFDEVAEAGKFDGRTPTAVAPAQPISAMWTFGPGRATIDQFDDARPDRNTLGGANVTPATGVFDEITVANENVAGAGITAYQLPHIDRALRYSPAPLPGLGPTVPGLPTTVTPPVWRTTIPAGSRDFRRHHLVTFRVTKKYDPTQLAAGTAVLPTVRVRLIGPTAAAMHTQTAVSRLSSLPVLRRLPVIAAAGCLPFALDLTKVHYETWEVDLASYAAAMSIKDVRFIELEIDTAVGQPVYIDTLSLVRRP